jgi:hypothetical protein
MNMYVSPDQNTVVLWAGENPPQLLEFDRGGACDLSCSLCNPDGGGEDFTYCREPENFLRRCCPAYGRTTDRHVGNFTPALTPRRRA